MKTLTITPRHTFSIVRKTEGRLNTYQVWLLRPRGKALRHPRAFGTYKAAFLFANQVGLAGKIRPSLWEQP